MRTVWAILGIGPTRDRGAIRRAYAEKLKQTNPEDDPEGFQELRQAYELVLRQVSLPSMAEAEAAAAEPLRLPETVEPTLATLAPEPVAAEPAPSDLIAEHWQACRGLHQRIVDQRPPAEELDQALAQILSSPVMENLSVRAETERGLAHTILNLAPHADGLIGRCIAFFGWNESINQFGGMPEARAVIQRAETLRFATELERRSHAHHRAYQIMKQPPPEGRLATAAAIARHRGNVGSFFAYASRQAPGIFSEFPRETVEFWTRHRAKSKPRTGRRNPLRLWRASPFFFFSIYVLVRVLIAVGSSLSGLADAPLAPPSSMEMRAATLAVIDGRALDELKAGAVTKAREDYDFALGQYPDDPEALFGRGITRVLTGDDAGNADKLAAMRSNSGIMKRFVDPAVPAGALMVFDTAPMIINQPTKKPVLPAGMSLKAPFSVDVRCLVGIDGDLHDCASRVPMARDQGALAETAIDYLRTAKASPGKYLGSPVADAPILLKATIGPRQSSLRH